MKALIVLVLVVLAAATAMAYGSTDVSAVRDAVSHGPWATEPAALLLSGSVLIGLGGVVRRFTL